MKNHRLGIVFLGAIGATVVGCFGSVQVVPASAAPPPPQGSGWFCSEAAFPPRGSSTSYTHSTRCHRTKDDCTTASDGARKRGAQVSFCEAKATAFCSATFTNAKDASWRCTTDANECSSELGGMAGVPGTKQSECTAVQ